MCANMQQIIISFIGLQPGYKCISVRYIKCHGATMGDKVIHE